MMAWRVLALWVLVVLAVAGAWGCEGEEEGTADAAGAADAAVDAAAVALGPCGQMGEPTVVLLRSLEFLRVEDGIAEGLDLDGVATVPGDGTGCGKADFTAPDGTPGVDNQFARLLPAIEAVGGADGFQSAIARAISSGGVLVTMELSHLDDAVDDACVDVTLGRAAGRPALGNDGLIEAGQTFERDTEAPSSAVEGAFVAGGVLAAGPFTMALPMVVDDIELLVTIHDMQVRAALHEDGHVTGLLAGAIVLDELNAFLDDIAENTALFAAIRNVLVANADLDPGEDGRCRRISIAVGFEGAPAFFFAP